ncbi:benomyl/methotrexate resistance protein [Morchella snyderi]|nr:benomyl/methotrexate resistance protein [Morchella snyderi]
MADLKDIEAGDIPSPVSPVSDIHTEDRGNINTAEKGIPLGMLGSEKSMSTQRDETAPEEADPNLVDWDGPEDPENPMNWPSWRKIFTVGIVSSITFITPLASSIFAPSIPQVMNDFNTTSHELAAFVVSVYVLGFAVGPLILAPASEFWGRNIIYHISNICFIGCTVACAESKSLAMLTVFRFFTGCFGSAPVTIGGGTIADVIPLEQRGAAIALFALGPILGPTIGPVAGGFLAEAKGWRWVFWLICILSGFVSLLALVFLKETYAPTILAAKARRLRKETGNDKLRSKMESPLPKSEILARSLVRPIKMLFLSPIVLLLSIFAAVCYGYLYLLFTTFPTVFEGQYHFSTGTVGLAYIGLGVGSLTGLIISGIFSDRILIAKKKKYGVLKPEYRLIPMSYLAPCIPVGLFWYGWAAQAETHWIVPIIGTTFVGIGILSTFMCVTTYLVDAFTVYAASALAANTVLRSVLGGVLPLAGSRMYERLGLGWGNSLLAFIALAMCPMPVLFNMYGERIRKRYDVKW